MSATDVIEKPQTTDTGNPPPSIYHLVCDCQEKAETGGFARCGCKVAGKTTYLVVSKQSPMIICVVCRDLRDNHVPCKFCGKP